MIKIIDGNLLDAKTDIIAHQVNCQGAFNSGVAKAIREFDECIYNDYKTYIKYAKEFNISLLGKISFVLSEKTISYLLTCLHKTNTVMMENSILTLTHSLNVSVI